MGPAKEWKDAENAPSSTKGEPVLRANTKEQLFVSLFVVFAEKREHFLSLHKVPPANAGRGEATLMLMQALWSRYRLMQPLSPVLPAHLLKAKRHFLSLSKENFFHRDEAIMRRTSSRQMEESESDSDFTWLQHLEDFSPLFPIIIKSLSRAYINWHEGHLPSSKWSFLK